MSQLGKMFKLELLKKEKKNRPANSGSIAGSGKSPKEGNGNLLQYSCLGNPMHRQRSHGVINKQTNKKLELLLFLLLFALTLC